MRDPSDDIFECGPGVSVNVPGLELINTLPQEITGMVVCEDYLVATTADGRVWKMADRGRGEVTEVVANA